VKQLGVLMAAAFVDMVGFAMVFPLLPFYAVRLGGEGQAWLVGPMIASFSIAQLASSPVWGRLSDRYGRRPVLLSGLFASALAFLVFGFATSVGLLFASRIVQGLGGGTTGVIQAYVSDTTDPSQRARGLGWISAATSAGVMIGPAIGSLAFARFGPPGPGVAAATLCLLNVLFAWRYLPESRPGARRGTPRRSVRAAVWHVVRHPQEPAPRLIWIYAVGMGAFASMSSVVALFLRHQFGLSEATIGWVFLYIGGLSVVMRALVLGWLVDRFGETRVMRLGAILLVVGLLLYPVPETLLGAALVIPLVPMGTALLFPSVTALASHRADPAELGQTMGVQQAFGGMARVIGPMWATPVFQLMGPADPFLLAAMIMTVTCALAFRVPVAAEIEDAPAIAD
jgi:MFS family permease